MGALKTLLAGFFDYAGLYPPAHLSLQAAAMNYLEYASGEQAWALGRFVIDAKRLKDLRSAVGEEDLRRFKLSAIVSSAADMDEVSEEIEKGSPVDTVEIKWLQPNAGVIEVTESLTTYLEVECRSQGAETVDLISGLGVRAKIRMGGLVAEAFPEASLVAETLYMLASRRCRFKATAGLHHPVRSNQPLTYEAQSERSTMHGFINVCCAAAVLYFGGSENDAERALLEEDRATFSVNEEVLRWRDLCWTEDQLATLRRDFFISIGSCSFKEPVEDLQALGWL